MICWCTIHYHQPGLLQISKNLQIPFITPKISSIIMGQKKQIFLWFCIASSMSVGTLPRRGTAVSKLYNDIDTKYMHMWELRLPVIVMLIAFASASSWPKCWGSPTAASGLASNTPRGSERRSPTVRGWLQLLFLLHGKSLAMCFCCPS